MSTWESCSKDLMISSRVFLNQKKTSPNTFFSEDSSNRNSSYINRTLDNIKQALNDLNIAINLDNNYSIVYLNRAKLYFKQENYSKAL